MCDLSDRARRIPYHLRAHDIDAVRDLPRNQGKGIIERLVASELLKQKEDQNIDADERVVDERRRRAVGIIVAYRKPRFILFLLLYGSATIRIPRFGPQTSLR